ncbi:helicase with zinc finger domain [Mizuhopecten yessoensis]|uniref:Helicase with zinc finger domain n=1 Tax=Mizuhopecten yessoensis TaxID=6573 RepID=A0A210QA63_MIZYE|nr:helicase with zinc finger domain [Mizuhopecten yessoensis]
MDKGALKDDHMSKETGTSPVTDLQDYLTRITSLLKQRNFHEALDICDTALNEYRNEEKLQEKKIKILCHQGRFEEAYNIAKKWSLRDPKNFTAQKELKRLKIVIHALNDQDEDSEEEESESIIEEVDETKEETEDDDKRSSPEGMETENSHNSITQTQPDNHSVITPQTYSPQTVESDKRKHVCTFCNIRFDQQEELDTHCKSDLHRKKITADDDQNWKYREPPRGFGAEDYSLCKSTEEIGKCAFSDKCTEAHSKEELAEWQMRFKFRKQLIKVAHDKQLHGNTYAEQLIEKLMNSDNPKSLMVSNVDYSKVHVNSDLKVNMTSKKCTSAWTFTITSKRSLHIVALLDDTYRTYFHIASISVGPKKTQKYQNLETHCQEWVNPEYPNVTLGEYVYRVKVVFKTDIYGTFRQTLVMDYGFDPVLSRELQVESAPITDTEKVFNDFLQSNQGRWKKNNVQLLPFALKPIPNTAIEDKLLAKYSLPDIEKFRFEDHLMHSPTKETYRIWMHEMLYVEEWSQLDSISRYSLNTSLQLVNRFLLVPGMISGAKYAQDGELFARMALEDRLSEDYAGGRLILNSTLAWLAPQDQKKKEASTNLPKVYEAVIEDKGKNFIFLRLSKECVDELHLSCDQEFSVQIQFQLNRLPKCEMHAAIDRLPTLDLVFPPPNKFPTTSWVKGSPELSEVVSTKLNEKQREAILKITAEGNLSLPPILLVGPYGTGKTYTLAQAAKQILQQDDTRILICTHSNSAADLYIKEFLHPMVKEGYLEARPLRLYFRHRWIQTVPEVVIQYCIRATAGSSGIFRCPVLEDVEKHRIVITTLGTARYLCDLDLEPGFFTHIFLDEAAQAMECDSLIPLSLCGPYTRVVLAGDHMQLSPEIYSDLGRQQGFHKSMLERLHELYPDDVPCKVMLCENYRSHSAIIDFTSDLFYESQLMASSDQPCHPLYYPLTFYSARGEEVQHENSIGFYNIAEVHEVIDRVDQLVRSWPSSEWGELGEGSIGVLTPYTDQVFHIRSELRKRKYYNIKVERVFNVQGKQFRVVILSTVRTRHSCSADTIQEDVVNYGFLSDIKLLNTAITRAQSLVMVIGDPVSLCLVGKCRNIWEYYLEICHDNNSIFGTTWNQLKTQLTSADMRKTYILNPLAPEFVPNRVFHITTPELTQHAISGSHASNHGITQQPQYYMGQRMTYPGQQFTHPQMFPQPYMPVPYPGLVPHVVFNRQGMPHIVGSPAQGRPPVRGYHPRHASPLAAIPKIRPGDKDKVKIDPTQPDVILAGKKMPSGAHRGRQIMYMPQRMSAAYQQMYYYPQHYGGYYYMQDDPRVLINQQHPRGPLLHQLGPHAQHPSQFYPILRPHYASLGPDDAEDKRSSQTSSPASSQGRSGSPATSPGSSVASQQIQLLPNVRHVPIHLFPKTATSTSSSRSSTPQRTESPQRTQDTGTIADPQASQKIEAGYLKSSSPALEHQERRGSANSPLARVIASAQRQAPTNAEGGLVLSTPYSSGFGDMIMPGQNGDVNDLVKKEKQKRTPVGLRLETGFSRQFSEDLETPTEITDLVKMMDETIDEGHESAEEEEEWNRQQTSESSSFFVSRTTSKTTSRKLHLKIPQQSSIETSESSGSPPSSPPGQDQNQKPTYAGMLRRRLPSATNDIDPSLLEPQTPHTPAGFVSPGTDIDTDPLGILRNLNINASTEKQRTYKYFS